MNDVVQMSTIVSELCDTVSTVSTRHSVSYNDVVRAVLHELELRRIRDVLTVKPLSYTYYDTEYYDTK